LKMGTSLRKSMTLVWLVRRRLSQKSRFLGIIAMRSAFFSRAKSFIPAIIFFFLTEYKSLEIPLNRSVNIISLVAMTSSGGVIGLICRIYSLASKISLIFRILFMGIVEGGMSSAL